MFSLKLSGVAQNRNSTQPLQSLHSTQDSSFDRSSDLADDRVDGNNPRHDRKYHNKYQHSILENALILGLVRFPIS